MAIRTVLLGAAALATTLFAVSGVAKVEADARARAALLRVFGRNGATVSAVSVNPFTGHMTVRGLAVGFANARLEIGRLDLERAPLQFVSAALAADSDPAAVGHASAENIVLADGPTTFRVPHLVAAGTTLHDADLAALLDPESAEPVEARLRRLEAGSIIAPEVHIDSATGANEQHWTLKQVLLANVVAGRVASGSVGVTSLAAKTAGDVDNVEVGGFQFTGADLPRVARVLETVRSDDKEQLLSLVDTASANAIAVTDVTHDRGYTAATIKADGLKGRALRTPPLARSGTSEPAGVTFLDDLLGSVSLATIEVDALATVAPAPARADAATFRFGRVALQELNARGIGRLEVADGHYIGDAGRFDVASLHANGLKLSSPATIASASTAAVPTLDGVELTDASVDAEVPGDGTPAQRIAFRLAHAAYAAPTDAAGRLPPKVTSSLDHLTFDVSPEGASTRAFAAMGYKKLDLSSALESTYDEPKQLLSLGRWTVGGSGLGSAQLKFDLANVGEGLASSVPSLAKAAAIAIVFKDADLVLRDDGLVGKAIAYKASLDGLTVAAERDVLASMVTAQLPALIGDPPKLHPLEAALAQFLAAPKSLHVSVTAHDGIGVADVAGLANPLDVLDLIDIKASANE